MTLTLHHFPNSLCSGKVRMALAEKQAAYRSRVVNLLDLDALEPDYVRLNRKAVVPTLDDNGEIVRDSLRILRHIDRTLGAPVLTPANDAARAVMDHWLGVQDALPLGLVSFASARWANRFFLRRFLTVRRAKTARLMREAPHLREAYARKLEHDRAFRALVSDPEAAATARATVTAALDALDAHLGGASGGASGGGPFIAGTALSLADCAWAAVLWRCREAKLERFGPDTERTHLAAYVARLSARPSFRAALSDWHRPWALWAVIGPALPALLLGDWLIEV